MKRLTVHLTGVKKTQSGGKSIIRNTLAIPIKDDSEVLGILQSLDEEGIKYSKHYTSYK